MSYEVIHDGKDRVSWLAARKQGIGGSDAPVVLGVSPWRSPLDLYVEKISDVSDDNGNEATHWGNLLEPLILQRFAEKTGRAVKRDGRLLRSKDREWQLATLDGLQVAEKQSGLVEIKATSLREKWDNGPPNYVLAQVQHQLAVTGLPFASVAALFSGKEFAYWDIQRDEALIQSIIEAEEAFWWLVLTRTPPAPDADDKKALAKLFPKVTEETPVALADERFLDIDRELQKAKADMSWIKASIDKLENELRAAIGPFPSCVLPNGVIYTNKETHRDSYTIAAADFRQLRRVKPK